MTLLPAPPLSRDSTLVLASLTEPSNNDLRLVVIEVRPSVLPQDQADFVQMRPIEPQSDSRVFEITWWRYVTYAIRNESYFAIEQGEVYSGSTGTRDDTALLAYVKATTFASEDFPGALTHYFVYAGWHCVDVVSDTSPEVRELTGGERHHWISNPLN